MTQPRPLKPRGLYRALYEAIESQPLVVLRGARAVGKTTLAQEVIQRRGGELVRLDDPPTADEVARDPYGWVRGRRTPTVLDEAQRVPGLLPAVKRVVDEDPQRTRLLLTGSVELPRDQLGGADPLAGRAISLELHPLVQRELRAPTGQPELSHRGGIASLLYADSLSAAEYPRFDSEQRGRTLRRGGLPRLATSARIPTSAITEWVTRVIGDDLTGRFDRGIAVRLLRLLASETSAIQTVSSLGEALGGAKHDTILRHVDRLESAFLVRRLPAERGRVRASLRAHPKIHVTDSLLAIWGGADTGHQNETFVVNEILNQLSFAHDGHEYDASYWRDSRGRVEVDLLVARDHRERVGVEIKSATAVSGSDLVGLRTLRDQEVIARGFVVYSGNRMYKLDDGIWALPVSALWEPPRSSERRQSVPRPTGPGSVTGPGQVSVFLSYARKDDQSWGGAILRTAHDLVAMLESETGETVRLFTDHDIAWGQEWRNRLSDELDAATFLIPIVTPLYLRSAACREELLEFSNKLDAPDRSAAILPLVWTMPAALSEHTEGDEVVRRLREAQYVDWTGKRALNDSGGDYRGALAELAQRLRLRLDDSVNEHRTASQSTLTEPDDLDLMAEMASIENRLGPATREFEVAVTTYMTAFGSIEQPTGEPSTQDLVDWSKQLSGALTPASANLDATRADVSRLMVSMGQVLDGMRGLLRRDPALRQQLMSEEVLDGLDLGVDRRELEVVLGQLDMIGAFFAPLRAPLQSLRAAVQLFGDLETTLASWRDLVAGR